METVERDFSRQGVKFYYIYKALAHPGTNGYVAPFDLKERLMHVAEAKRTLGSRIEWLCDSMENDLKHALGDRPNSEFVIDPDGKIVVARRWSNPGQLFDDLSELVGEVAKPTLLTDIEMKRPPPPQRAPTGIVPPLQLPHGMKPIRVEPLESKSPHYAKLRAEMSGDHLYLGFFLDPLYKVHWNNKAPALTFEITAPAGIKVTPDHGAAAKVDVDADADPREFLLTVSGRRAESLRVTVKYFACDDAETFCVPVTQQYRVTMDQDRDGGSRRTTPGRRGRAAPSRPDDGRQRLPVYAVLDQDGNGTISSAEMRAAPKQLRTLDRDGDGELTEPELSPRERVLSGRGEVGTRVPNRSAILRMFEQRDRDRDGTLSGREIPPPMRRRMGQMDANQDGQVSRQELESMLRRP